MYPREAAGEGKRRRTDHDGEGKGAGIQKIQQKHRSTKPGTTDIAAHSCGKMIAAHWLSARAPSPLSAGRGEEVEGGRRGVLRAGCWRETGAKGAAARGGLDGEMPAPDSLIAAAQLCVPLWRSVKLTLDPFPVPIYPTEPSPSPPCLPSIRHLAVPSPRTSCNDRIRASGGRSPRNCCLSSFLFSMRPMHHRKMRYLGPQCSERRKEGMREKAKKKSQVDRDASSRFGSSLYYRLRSILSGF